MTRFWKGGRRSHKPITPAIDAISSPRELHIRHQTPIEDLCRRLKLVEARLRVALLEVDANGMAPEDENDRLIDASDREREKVIREIEAFDDSISPSDARSLLSAALGVGDGEPPAWSDVEVLIRAARRGLLRAELADERARRAIG